MGSFGRTLQNFAPQIGAGIGNLIAPGAGGAIGGWLGGQIRGSGNPRGAGFNMPQGGGGFNPQGGFNFGPGGGGGFGTAPNGGGGGRNWGEILGGAGQLLGAGAQAYGAFRQGQAANAPNIAQVFDPTNPILKPHIANTANFATGLQNGNNPFAGMTSDLQRQSTGAIGSYLTEQQKMGSREGNLYSSLTGQGGALDKLMNAKQPTNAVSFGKDAPTLTNNFQKLDFGKDSGFNELQRQGSAFKQLSFDNQFNELQLGQFNVDNNAFNRFINPVETNQYQVGQFGKPELQFNQFQAQNPFEGQRVNLQNFTANSAMPEMRTQGFNVQQPGFSPLQLDQLRSDQVNAAYRQQMGLERFSVEQLPFQELQNPYANFSAMEQAGNTLAAFSPVFERNLRAAQAQLNSAAPGRFSSAFVNQGQDLATKALQDYNLFAQQLGMQAMGLEQQQMAANQQFMLGARGQQTDAYKSNLGARLQAQEMLQTGTLKSRELAQQADIAGANLGLQAGTTGNQQQIQARELEQRLFTDLQRLGLDANTAAQQAALQARQMTQQAATADASTNANFLAQLNQANLSERELAQQAALGFGNMNLQGQTQFQQAQIQARQMEQQLFTQLQQMGLDANTAAQQARLQAQQMAQQALQSREQLGLSAYQANTGNQIQARQLQQGAVDSTRQANLQGMQQLLTAEQQRDQYELSARNMQQSAMDQWRNASLGANQQQISADQMANQFNLQNWNQQANQFNSEQNNLLSRQQMWQQGVLGGASQAGQLAATASQNEFNRMNQAAQIGLQASQQMITPMAQLLGQSMDYGRPSDLNTIVAQRLQGLPSSVAPGQGYNMPMQGAAAAAGGRGGGNTTYGGGGGAGSAPAAGGGNFTGNPAAIMPQSTGGMMPGNRRLDPSMFAMGGGMGMAGGMIGGGSPMGGPGPMMPPGAPMPGAPMMNPMGMGMPGNALMQLNAGRLF